MKRLLISALFIASMISFASAQDISGDWQGPLTTPMGELRLVLHITRQSDGTWKVIMDSPDQGLSSAPLDTFTLDAGKVHFTLNAAKGVFDGSLKGTTISGNWMQGAGGQKMPLSLSKTATPLKLTHDPAPPSDIDGTWEGTMDSQSQGKQHFTFRIKNTADGLTATADIPQLDAKGWPATTVIRKGSSVKIEMRQFTGTFHGKLNKDLTGMTGDWTTPAQGMDHADVSNALSLKRTKEPAADAPKTDAPAAPNK
jgi:hypothetical protein